MEMLISNSKYIMTTSALRIQCNEDEKRYFVQALLTNGEWINIKNIDNRKAVDNFLDEAEREVRLKKEHDNIKELVFRTRDYLIITSSLRTIDCDRRHNIQALLNDGKWINIDSFEKEEDVKKFFNCINSEIEEENQNIAIIKVM